MSFEPYLGQIRMVAFDFAPHGYALCNGQILSIQQNQALFSLLGTTYGGNGITNFALPNLQGRAPIHFGQGNGLSDYVQGQTGGEVSHVLTASELPTHTHTLGVNSGAGDTGVPTNHLLAQAPQGLGNTYGSPGNAAMAAATVSSVGQGQSHENQQPYLTVNFVIALVGVFPSRN